MNIKKAIVNKVCIIGDNLKPFLIKIIPKKFLKKAKQKILHSAYSGSGGKIPYDSEAFPFGVNLVGYIKAQMGLGQGCRLIASALEGTGIPFGIIETRVGNPFNHTDSLWDGKLTDEFKNSINIFHVNPEQMPYLQVSLPSDVLDRHYNIGIWLWELPDFPDEWCECFALVDEVWAPSRFNCESIQKKANVPVTLIPYGIEADYDDRFDRKFFGLPEDKFLFLCMLDINSTMERKNPIGAIRAFKKAFLPENQKVGLVIKINNSSKESREVIASELSGYGNIYIIDKTLEKTEVNSLIKVSDAFVSLHRAEGFGLVIAEAMYLGTPVVATNWSANVDFMNEENSCPIRYKLTEIGHDIGVYKAYQQWAEPDIEHAAECMKRLFESSGLRDKLSFNAMRFIKENFSVEKSAEAINKRLGEIK